MNTSMTIRATGTNYTQWPDHYDWYNAYLSLRPILHKSGISPQSHSQVLHVGVGSSQLQNDLNREGYLVTNIDFSSVATENLISCWNGKVPMKYAVADVRNMHQEFKDGSFDLVLDKGRKEASMAIRLFLFFLV